MPRYYWDTVLDNVLMEKDQAGDTIAINTHDPERFGELNSQRRDGITSYYHFDGNRSTRALTDLSESVTDTDSYDAWGNEVAHSGSTENPYRWVGATGYHREDGNGRYYVRARHYSAPVARWLSYDPLGYRSGTNQYTYGANQPVLLIDPSGQDPNYVITTVGGVIVSVTIPGLGQFVGPNAIGNAILAALAAGDAQTAAALVTEVSTGAVQTTRPALPKPGPIVVKPTPILVTLLEAAAPIGLGAFTFWGVYDAADTLANPKKPDIMYIEPVYADDRQEPIIGGMNQ